MPLLACDVLLTLVPTLQVEIMVEWLSFKDIVRLDSALCSLQHRYLFQNILKEDYCVFKNMGKWSHSQIVWVILKRVFVSVIDIPVGFNFEKHAMIFATTGKYLQRLNMSSMIGHNPASNISDTVKNSLVSCVNLRVLDLPGVDLNLFDIRSVLSISPRLQGLNLTYCSKLSGEVLVAINQDAKHLQTLILSNCEVSGALPPESLVENHTILTIMMLSLTGSPFPTPFLHACKALRTLCLSGVPIQDVFALLGHCPALRTVSAGVTTNFDVLHGSITDEEVSTLIPLIQKLDVLHMYHHNSNYLRDDQLLRIIQQCHQLSALFLTHISHPHSIAGCVLEAAARVQPGVKGVHKLNELRVNKISSTLLQNVLDVCPLLTCFKYMESWDPADAADLMTVIGNSSIKSLEFGSCGKTDFLPLRALTSLTLSYGFELTHEDVVGVVNRNPLLQVLSIIQCPALTQDTLMHIVEKCVHLEKLEFSNLDPHSSQARSIDTSLIVKLIQCFRPKLMHLSLNVK